MLIKMQYLLSNQRIITGKEEAEATYPDGGFSLKEKFNILANSPIALIPKVMNVGFFSCWTAQAHNLHTLWIVLHVKFCGGRTLIWQKKNGQTITKKRRDNHDFDNHLSVFLLRQLSCRERVFFSPDFSLVPFESGNDNINSSSVLLVQALEFCWVFVFLLFNVIHVTLTTPTSTMALAWCSFWYLSF